MLIAAAAFTTAAFAYDYDTKVPVPGKPLPIGKDYKPDNAISCLCIRF